MKFIYTIFFFVDILALVILSYLFLKEIDVHRPMWILVITLIAIFVSILILTFLLLRYIKLPSARRLK